VDGDGREYKDDWVKQHMTVRQYHDYLTDKKLKITSHVQHIS